MHVAVLGMLIYWLCRRLRLHPRWITLIAMSAVVFYGAVALPSPPVLRSVMLCVALGLGMLLCRSINAIQLLAISVLTILIIHPLDIYNAGFELSFVTVLGLMILVRRVMPLTRDIDAEVAINTEGGNPPRRLVVRHRIRQWLAPALVCGLIAWVVSMPLIAYHFDQLNPWAVVASLLLAIPVFLALTAGFLKIILTFCFPFAAHFWAALAAIPVAWMRAQRRLARQNPRLRPSAPRAFRALHRHLLRPTAPASRSHRPAGAAIDHPLLARARRDAARAHPAGRRRRALPGESLNVTALAVGAGQCAVIELPDGRLILLDAGSATLTDPMHKCIMPYLRARGRSTIDEIWIADCDFDHIGAVADLIRTFNVPKIVVSNRFEHDAQGKPADEALLELIQQRHIALMRLSLGDHIPLGKSASIDVLWPPPTGKFGLTNNDDLVLKLNYARRTILFPSDIQQTAQTALLKSPGQLHCDAMLAPHHGSGETTTPAFITAADPLYIVSSNDRTLTQKQFHFEHQIGDRPLFRTNRTGATTITIDRTGGLTVTPYLQERVVGRLALRIAKIPVGDFPFRDRRSPRLRIDNHLLQRRLRRAITGLKFQHRAKFRRARRGIAQLRQRSARVVMRLAGLGIQRQRLPQHRQRLGRPLHFDQDMPEVHRQLRHRSDRLRRRRGNAVQPPPGGSAAPASCPAGSAPPRLPL